MDSEKLANTWAAFYHTAFSGGAAIMAAGRPLQVGYTRFDDLHKYADHVASEALQAAVDIAREVRGAIPPAASTEDVVPF